MMKSSTKIGILVFKYLHCQAILGISAQQTANWWRLCGQTSKLQEMNCLNTYFAKILNIFLKHKSAGRCFQHSEETWLEYCVFMPVPMSQLRNPRIRCIHCISIVDQLVLAPRNVAAATCFTALAETTTESGRPGTVQNSTAQYSTVQLYSAGAGGGGGSPHWPLDKILIIQNVLLHEMWTFLALCKYWLCQ